MENITCNYCSKISKSDKSCRLHQAVCPLNPNVPKGYCKFCNTEFKNRNTAAQHQRFCEKNPNKYQLSNIQIKTLSDNGKKTGGKYGICSLNSSDPCAIAIRKKSRDTYRERLAAGEIVSSRKGKKMSDEQRNNISIYMKKAVVEHRDSYDKRKMYGRAKRYEYNGSWVHGTWELTLVIYLDYNNIKWERVTTPFKYSFENKELSYYPDFFLPEKNLYIEVKGYETDKDRAKWMVFPHNLIVLAKNEIFGMQNGTYRIFDNDTLIKVKDNEQLINAKTKPKHNNS